MSVPSPDLFKDNGLRFVTRSTNEQNIVQSYITKEMTRATEQLLQIIQADMERDRWGY